MIIEALQPLAADLGSLKEDPRNARLHNDANLQALQFSLKKFGQRKPIVALEDGTIIAGNGTFRAAKALGWTQLAVVRVKDDPTTAAAYALADNRTAELATWDDKILTETLNWLNTEHIEIHDLGFELADFQTINPDYSILNDGNQVQDLDQMRDGVRKAIQIEFPLEHYEEAVTLVKFWRALGGNIGQMLLEKLRSEKEALKA